MPKTIQGLDELIFYAIDKASPYALSLHAENDSLDKIRTMPLVDLLIVGEKTVMMWLWINAHSGVFGAKPVSPLGIQADTVDDVVKAVYATVDQKAGA